jgi:3',5'-cyclic AMP phosphodiesterase CpdA
VVLSTPCSPYRQGQSSLVTTLRSTPEPIRIAAIGDLHLRTTIPGFLADELRAVDGNADLLVIAGDITDGGKIPEVELAAELLSTISMPIVAVLGNHDRRGVRRKAMRDILERSGVLLLDGDACTMDLPGGRLLGLAGVGGYGGGFWPDEGSDLVSARLTKAVGLRGRREAVRLDRALAAIADQPVDATVVVMHYSPTVSTLGAEPILKYWMLGNSLLGNVIDSHAVDLVIHGHAHLGNQVGQTPGGVPVRNVAAHVTGRPTMYDIQAPRHVTDLTPAGDRVGLSSPIGRAS